MSRHLFLAVFSAFGLVSSAMAHADDPAVVRTPELNEAIAKLKTWRSSFATLRVTWKWSNPGQLIERMPELENDEVRLAGWYHVHELLWTDRQLVRHTAQHFQNGQLAQRDISARNAKLQFGADYIGESQFPHQLGAKAAGPGTVWHFATAMPLQRVYYSNNTWLSDKFDQSQPVSVGTKEIDGALCVGCRLFPKWPETLWLDLEHDGLVRKIDIDNGQGMSWECTEFQQIESSRWFPKRGTYRQHPSDTPYWFEVVAITMNELTPTREFDPPPIDAQTIVVDRSGGLLGIPKDRKTPNSASTTSDSPPPTGPSVIARPDSNRWLWFTALGLGSVILGLGWFRRRRQ